MRALGIVWLWVLAALVAPSSALAHAQLVRSDPADRAVVRSSPPAVRLVFDDAIQAIPGMKAVRNGGGSVLAGRPRVERGREIVIPLRARLPRGDYTVLWRALSDDGHVLAGVVAFAVGAGRPPPQPALATPSETRPLQAVARWLFLAGVLTASGAALFTLALRRRAEPPQALFVVGFLLVLAGGVILQDTGSLSTRFGRVIAFANLVAAVGAAIALLARRFPRAAAASWVAALLLLPTPSLAGHALDAGRPLVELPVDVLHVAASSVWLGGLLALALALRRGDADREAVARFSTLAAASVAVLAATGIVRAFGELSSLGQILGTGYGRLLVVKSALLGLLVALGWINRYRIVPALMRSVRRLRRNLVAELAIFGALLAAVAVLTQSRPGRDHARLVAAASAATGPQRPSAAPEDAAVVQQTGPALQLAGPAVPAVSPDGRSLYWEMLGSDDDETAGSKLVTRDLATRRTRTLAVGVAPQDGMAVTSQWVVYATATIPARVVAVRRDGRGRTVLGQGLVAPLAGRGERVAWAEQTPTRQRVLVRDMARGTTWVAADAAPCDEGRCHRIDDVTLADGGVAFDRAVVGGGSAVVRRAYSGTAAEDVALPRDPQPDLIASSAGAAFYAIGRGWLRWDFGSPRPRRTAFAATDAAQPVAFERGVWLLEEHNRCGDRVLAQGADGRRAVVAAPARILALADAGAGFCAKVLSTTSDGRRPVTSWAVAPAGSHGTEGATGVVLVGDPFA